MGTKNKLASLAFLQRKPYINARVPAVLNRCVTGERLRERERERERERVAKLLEWPNISAILFSPLTIIIAFCLIAFVKSGAKIQNFPRTISFPLEKLTNRHEKGAGKAVSSFCGRCKEFLFQPLTNGQVVETIAHAQRIIHATHRLFFSLLITPTLYFRYSIFASQQSPRCRAPSSRR